LSWEGEKLEVCENKRAIQILEHLFNFTDHSWSICYTWSLDPRWLRVVSEHPRL
jgi:hypothetical protein